jgi:hypothetical protein
MSSLHHQSIARFHGTKIIEMFSIKQIETVESMFDQLHHAAMSANCKRKSSRTESGNVRQGWSFYLSALNGQN